MGRTKPVVEGDAAHHSPCSIKKARLKSNAAQALLPGPHAI
jgi:hypothetical protein